MKQFLTISFFLVTLTSYSQNYKFNIQVCPFSLIDDFSFPTIQGGLEIKLSNRLTLYNEFGLKYRQGIYEFNDTSFIKSNGFKVKSEIRYYLLKFKGEKKIRKLMDGFYLGTNAFYTQDFHNSAIEYSYDKQFTNKNWDYFSVKKYVLSSNLVFGLQQTIAKHLLIDFYAGCGIRIRIIDDLNEEFRNGTKYFMHASNQEIEMQYIKRNIDLEEGLNFMPNLTLGFRIGFQF